MLRGNHESRSMTEQFDFLAQSNDIYDGEFYDGDRDQDGDTMPLPPISRSNGPSNTANTSENSSNANSTANSGNELFNFK